MGLLAFALRNAGFRVTRLYESDVADWLACLSDHGHDPLDPNSGMRWPRSGGRCPSPSSRCRRPDTPYTLGLVDHLLDSD